MFIYKTKTKAHKQCHTKWNEWENECMTKTAINKLSKYTQQQQSTSLSIYIYRRHHYLYHGIIFIMVIQRGNNNTAVTPPIQYACIFYRLSVGRRYLIGDTSHHQPYKLELVIIVINANEIKGGGVCMCDRWWERDKLMFLILSENPMRTAVIIVVVVNTLLKYKKKNNQMKVMQYGYTLLFSVRSSVECG